MTPFYTSWLLVRVSTRPFYHHRRGAAKSSLDFVKINFFQQFIAELKGFARRTAVSNYCNNERLPFLSHVFWKSITRGRPLCRFIDRSFSLVVLFSRKLDVAISQNFFYLRPSLLRAYLLLFCEQESVELPGWIVWPPFSLCKLISGGNNPFSFLPHCYMHINVGRVPEMATGVDSMPPECLFRINRISKTLCSSELGLLFPFCV